jgi:ABC-2 type transport system permease protein
MTGTVRRWTLQTLTFARKEIVDAVSQPRLLLTLVLGPFLIMAAFGLGYKDQPTRMKTMLVVADDNPLKGQLDKYTKDLETFVDVVGTTSDEAEAQRKLQDGDIDVMVQFPSDPIDDISQGNRAKIEVVHTRLDPVQRTAIAFASELAVDKINAGVLAALIGAGQQAGAAPLGGVLDTANASMQQLRSAVDSGDPNAVKTALDELDLASSAITAQAANISALTAQVAEQGSVDQAKQLATQAQALSDRLADAHANGDQLDAATVDQMADTLNTVRTDVGKLAEVDPSVLSQPFTSDVQLAVPGTHRITDWYAPAAIVLILQQFGLAFGAMSFVRERQLGITDVLRIAPIGALPAVIGKYIAYLLLGGVMGAILTFGVVELLDVPLSGSVGAMAAVMALTLFASIGLGLTLSLLCRTDGQAIQYALLVLLASLFFSGFFLSVDALGTAAQAIAWLLPVTYGMRMLRDVMLRGTDPDWQQMAYLIGYGVVLFGLTLFGAHRRMVAKAS